MVLLISVPFGRTLDIAITRCKNILEYVEDAITIVNFAEHINLELFKETFKDVLNKKIYINTIPRADLSNNRFFKIFPKNILDIHIKDFLFAVQNNIEFTHMLFVSDTDYFIRKGIYKFMYPYDAGFFVTSCSVKPLSLDINEFMPGTYYHQKMDPFWITNVFNNPDFTHIYSEHMEGQFYKKELFQEILNYIEKLPVHYTKAISNVDESIFSNVYLHIFRDKYPLLLPIHLIMRDDSICENPERLYNLLIKKDIRKDMVNLPHTYEVFHPFLFGIKRVKSERGDDKIVDQCISTRDQYMKILEHNMHSI
jgi:hypothetical protein